MAKHADLERNIQLKAKCIILDQRKKTITTEVFKDYTKGDIIIITMLLDTRSGGYDGSAINIHVYNTTKNIATDITPMLMTRLYNNFILKQL